MEYLSALKKSVVAGLMIGIGCTVFLNMDNSIVASFLFGLGLFTIINLELNLFTGKILWSETESVLILWRFL